MTSSARLAAAGMTATTVMLLTAGLSMLQPLSTDLYLPTLPAIAAHFDASVATVQWTLSIFVAVFGLWQLAAGPLTDRYGRYPLVLLGVTVYAAASLLCMVAPSMTVLIAGRALQALGACSCLVGARGFVRDLYSPSEGARMLAAAATIMSFAPLLGPLIGAQLAGAFGWRAAFAALAVFASALTALAAWKLKETNRQLNPHALTPGPMLRVYGAVLRSPTFRAYTLTAAATYSGLFAFISGSSFVLMRTLGLSSTAFAFAFSTMVAGYLVGTLVCRRLLPRIGMQRTVAAGALLQASAGVAMAGLALAGVHVPAAIVAPMFFYGVSHGVVQPPSQAGAVAPFPANAGAAAALLGVLMMLIAAVVGAAVAAGYNGTVYPMTLTIAACGLASALIAFTLVRRHGDVAHHG
jgi:DHA1 family bicyclomycin/chloramphenicol resistance-like MFS transporter